jgi:hypothetical protein
MPLSRLLIQGAVKCPNWQEFRRSLKGISTERKLIYLLEYVKPLDWRQRRASDKETIAIVAWKLDDCDVTTRQVQILNYLTALSRGGQIAPVPERYQYVDQVEGFLRAKRYVILK